MWWSNADDRRNPRNFVRERCTIAVKGAQSVTADGGQRPKAQTTTPTRVQVESCRAYCRSIGVHAETPAWLLEVASKYVERCEERFSSRTIKSSTRLRSPPLDDAVKVPPEPLSDERWLLINGVLTDPRLVLSYRQRLSEMFLRPLTLVYNPTNGLLRDSVEAVIGRALNVGSEPAKRLRAALHNQLLDEQVDRVLVIAHSQGAIIVSNALDLLFADEATRAHLQKLEIYTFGGAADEMTTERAPDHAGYIPHVENFANERDPIARMGVLQASARGKLGGHIYTRPAGGHLFNTHYLPYLQEFGSERAPPPRLLKYLDGRRPATAERATFNSF